MNGGVSLAVDRRRAYELCRTVRAEHHGWKPLPSEKYAPRVDVLAGTSEKMSQPIISAAITPALALLLAIL